MKVHFAADVIAFGQFGCDLVTVATCNNRKCKHMTDDPVLVTCEECKKDKHFQQRLMETVEDRR